MLGLKKSNILIIKTDGLAAFVAAEPVFSAIRAAHPSAKISLLTNASLQRIARAAPYFDQVAAMPNLRDAEAKKDFVRQLRTAKFERVYDLACDDLCKKLKASMGVFGPKWFSASPAPRRSAQKKSSADLPRIDRAMASAGIEAPERLPDLSWALEARKDSANMQPSWYGISGSFGLLLPGQSENNRWSAEGYMGLATIMARAGFMPVMAGPKELHHFGDEVSHEAPQLVDLTGKTDHLQLAALAQEAAFFVSDDAAEMHLALSVGCEGVMISNPSLSGSAPAGRHIVTLKSADSQPIEPAFVWRTLMNMGLIGSSSPTPMPAQAH